MVIITVLIINAMGTTGRACFCKCVSRSLRRAAANSCDSLRFDMAVARVRPPYSCVPEKKRRVRRKDFLRNPTQTRRREVRDRRMRDMRFFFFFFFSFYYFLSWHDIYNSSYNITANKIDIPYLNNYIVHI